MRDPKNTEPTMEEQRDEARSMALHLEKERNEARALAMRYAPRGTVMPWETQEQMERRTYYTESGMPVCAYDDCRGCKWCSSRSTCSGGRREPAHDVALATCPMARDWDA